MKILETERLILREISSDDAEFVLDLLNQPSFIKYIGDRGVRTLDVARDFIENRYRQSYRDHGFGLYTVKLKEADTAVGMCGFVKRDTLPHPDIGFAFLPQYGGKGYAVESAQGVMDFGRNVLNFKRVLALTTPDNQSSGRLLEKIGFKFERLLDEPQTDETLKLYSFDVTD